MMRFKRSIAVVLSAVIGVTTVMTPQSVCAGEVEAIAQQWECDENGANYFSTEIIGNDSGVEPDFKESTHSSEDDLLDVKMDMPASIYWSDTNAGCVHFSVVDVPTEVTDAEYYAQLYKDGKRVIGITKTAKYVSADSGSNYDFKRDIEENGNGVYTVTIKMESDTYPETNSDVNTSDEFTYVQPGEKLPSLSNVTVENNIVSWDLVEGAQKYAYEVYFNGKIRSRGYVTKNLGMISYIDRYGEGTYKIRLKAQSPNILQIQSSDYVEVIVDTNPTGGYDDLKSFVERLYTIALDRTADTEGLNNWIAMLGAGSYDGAGLAKEFVLGAEFAMRNLSNEDFVTVLYKTFFDREPDDAGKTLWMGELAAGKSREYVLSKFVNLEEFTILCGNYGIERGVMLENGYAVNPGMTQFVKRLYTTVLGRDADNDGLYNYVLALIVKFESAQTEAMSFFTSAEYIQKNKSNEAYVNDLYALFMNRTADSDGLKFWTDTLTVGMSRDEVLAQFAASAEFKAIAAGYGLE